MTDADVDGSHIELFTYFFNNSPFNKLIENGHIYLAQPPVKINKGVKSIYIKDEKLEDYILKSNKDLKKFKDYQKLELEKSKMNIQS